MAEAGSHASAAGSASSRAAFLRIRRGDRVLSDVPLGRGRFLVGGGITAQLRLKNAGLPDECLVLDTQATPLSVEGRLPAADLRLNGAPFPPGAPRPLAEGDRLEFAGLILELHDIAVPTPERPSSAGAAAPGPTAKFTTGRYGSDAPAPASHVPSPPTVAPPPPAPSPRPPPPPTPVPTPPTVAPRPSPAGTASTIDPLAAVPVEAWERTEISLAIADPGADRKTGETGISQKPWLEYLGGEGAADDRLTIGRNGLIAGRKGELGVRHPSISKKHARFDWRAGRLEVEDLKSTNGVWVNRNRIEGRSVLKDGDVLHLGSVEFRVHLPADPDDTSLSVATQTRSTPRPVPEGAIVPDGPELAEPTDPSIGNAPPARERSVAERSHPKAADPTEEGPAVDGEDGPPAASDRAGDPAAPAASAAVDGPAPEPPPASGEAAAPPPPATAASAFSAWERKTEQEMPAVPMPIAPDRRSRTIGEYGTDLYRRVEKRSKVGAKVLLGTVAIVLFLGAVAVSSVVAKRLARSREELVVGEMRRLGADGKPIDGPRGAAGTRGRSARGASGLPDGEGTLDPGDGAAGLDGEGLPADAGLGAENAEPLTAAGPEMNASEGLGGSPGELERAERSDPGGTGLAPGRDGAGEGADRDLRQARDFGLTGRKGIHFAEGTAVVRRYHPTNWAAPPGASESAIDADDRAFGASQIDTGKVNAQIRAQFPKVMKCVEGTKLKTGRSRIVVQFTVQLDGRVGDAQVLQSDVKGASVAACITSVVRSTTFPRPKDQSVVVQYPFVITYN